MAGVIVVAGGTDGIGRRIVLARLKRGDVVIAVGSNGDKGRRLLDDAARMGAGDRARFLRADLSSVAGCERVVEQIKSEHAVIDALVLCTNRVSTERFTTVDGLEYSFALNYLSRYLLGYGLRDSLETSARPVVLNVAAPGVTNGSVVWDDMQLERRYSAVKAQLQAGRANDLLGVAFAEKPGETVPYVLYRPYFTDTGFKGIGPPFVRAIARLVGKVFARSVEVTARPISELLDAPPRTLLTAIAQGKPVSLSLKTFDKDDARKLDEETRQLLARITAVRSSS